MIPIVFGHDQIKAKRVAFNKPVVMATNLGSQVLIHFKIHLNFLLTILITYAKFQNFCKKKQGLRRQLKILKSLKN